MLSVVGNVYDVVLGDVNRKMVAMWNIMFKICPIDRIFAKLW